MACILAGLRLYKKHVKRIVGVYVKDPGVSGKNDRRNDIDDHYANICELYDSLSVIPPDYEMQHCGSSYNVKCIQYFDENKTDQLNPTYEAKAYKWMKENIDINKEKTLFWIVGKGILDDEQFIKSLKSKKNI
jgi:hypothetical protein